MKFESALDEALWKRKKTNAWLVNATGLLPSTLSRYRRGQGRPMLDDFILLGTALPELQKWFNESVRSLKGP